MSNKKSRAWFICPQWAELISRHYSEDAEASRLLKMDPKVLAKLRSRTPVAKSTLLKILHRFAKRHDLRTTADTLIIDIRSP